MTIRIIECPFCYIGIPYKELGKHFYECLLAVWNKGGTM